MMFVSNPLQARQHRLRPAQMTAHIAADFHLNFRRRLAAKVRKEARHFLQPIERQPAPCCQRSQLPLRQPSQPILNSI
jgi:hypothetical protein